MVATARRPVKRPESPPPLPPPPVFGRYRCYWMNEFGRPCNRLLGAGSGPFEGVCPRCRRRVAFPNPNDRER